MSFERRVPSCTPAKQVRYLRLSGMNTSVVRQSPVPVGIQDDATTINKGEGPR